MNAFRTGSLALAVLAVLQGVASAESFRGRVTAVSAADKSFQITASNKETREIEIIRLKADSAEFDGIGSIDELSVGDEVTVEADPGDGGEYAAKSVSLGAATAPDEAAPVSPNPPAEDPAAAPQMQSVSEEAATGAAAPTGSTGASASAETMAAEKGDPSLE